MKDKWKTLTAVVSNSTDVHAISKADVPEFTEFIVNF